MERRERHFQVMNYVLDSNVARAVADVSWSKLFSSGLHPVLPKIFSSGLRPVLPMILPVPKPGFSEICDLLH